jgi:hypothetical protein
VFDKHTIELNSDVTTSTSVFCKALHACARSAHFKCKAQICMSA